MGNTTNAVGNAIEQTFDSATAIGDGQFGYRDSSPNNSWFYDYYTYTPTYNTTNTKDRYAGAVRYFDADGDGAYDSRSTYRDSDNDGRYDEYDRQGFYSATQKSSVDNEPATRTDVTVDSQAAKNDDTDRYRGPQDARRHTVKGEIAST